MSSPLGRFSAPTAAWFRASFSAPTAVQELAWTAISSGHDTLVVAPTGSGKTLAAFLWAIDTLATRQHGSQQLPGRPASDRSGPGNAGDERAGACRVLYISPLKALAMDVERNLRSPLVGIGHAATRLGLPRPDLRVAVRSGDTPAAERRLFARDPADILITTPESLFLLLTSAARDALRGIETVIVDEIHAVAGTKRGAHLALSLERLDALLPKPAQRIGLSATVRPIDEVGRFLTGGRPVEIVAPPANKRWDLSVVVPVPDLGAMGSATDDLTGSGAGDPRRTSIWPHVEERIVDLVERQHSTLVFVNSRRLAERLTARLNEIWAERLAAGDATAARDATGESAARLDNPGAHVPLPTRVGQSAGMADAGPEPSRPPVSRAAPAELMGASGSSRTRPVALLDRGARAEPPPLLARAHHGSVSREQRAQIEDDLKAGRLPAVVATSSLELGIDMGAVDLVVQVESPPSVASGLQRVGRAGHQVGATSVGVVFPKFRGDLVQSAVVVEAMRAGRIEALHLPANPLDVLAQQIVAMVALDDWRVDDLERLIHRSANFAGLTRAVLESVLDMLSGRYPSDEFAELRPRLVWDRLAGTLTGRRGAQHLAVTSGGTIPDRGLFGVFLAGADGPGRRVGELDEEMVYESRVGDTITLGTSTWLIEDITHDRVLVSPAPGQAGRLPFWRGDSLGRGAELGREVGAFVRELNGLTRDVATIRLRQAGLDDWAAENLLTYLDEQREATGHLPTDRSLLVEKFRDELGDWRVVVHSPFGAQVNAPWSMCVAARMRERHGVDVQAVYGDDGMVFRLPDTDWGSLEALVWGGGDASQPTAGEPAVSDVTTSDGVDQPRRSDTIDDWTGRHAGARPDDALADLLDIVILDPDEVMQLVTEQIGGSALFASRFRECASRALLLPKRRPDRRQALWQQRQRASALLEVAANYPSFPIVLEAVRECLQDVFDVPSLVELMRAVRSREVAVVQLETRAPSPFARSLMFGYVARFLYEGDSPLAEKRAAALSLDPGLLSELLGHSEGLELRDLLDPAVIASTEAELQHLVPDRQARDADDLADLLRVLGPLSLPELQARSRSPELVAQWLTTLDAARRVILVRIAGEPRWAAVEDAARLRDALGVSLPLGVADLWLQPVLDPLGELAARHARTHGPFTVLELAERLGLGVAVVRDVIRRLIGEGRLVEGEMRPAGTGTDLCDARVLRTLRRRSLAALRHEVEPVEPATFARFLPAWQGVGGRLRGTEGLLRVVEQLAGVVLPASALETLVLPSRVVDYRPAMLDELTAAGEVVWQGHGTLAGNDGWVSLHPAELAPVSLLPAQPVEGELPTAIEAELLGGGAYFVRALCDRLGGGIESAVVEALWQLTWAGHLTNDTLAPLRAKLDAGSTTHRRRPTPPRHSRYGSRPRLTGVRPPSAPNAVGRWSLLPAREPDPTILAAARAETLLDRYGVLTRGSVVAEELEGGFAGVYRVLAAAEEAGAVRRGYFVAGLGAAQFATVGAVDRLRATPPPSETGPPGVLVLAASDPANPFGAALAWPVRPAANGEARGHQPARKSGAMVALTDGELALFVERGGRTVLTFTDDPANLSAAASALAELVHSGRLAGLTVARIDGEPLPGSHHQLVSALTEVGFQLTPQGLRLRR